MGKNRKTKLLLNFLNDNDGPSSKDDRVLIIDGTNTFMRIWAAVPALNDNGDHIGGVAGFLKSIGFNIRELNATRCIIVFDGVGGSQRRRKLFPDYKAQRKNKVSLNRHDEFEDLMDEEESMKKQFVRIFEYLNNLPVTLISVDNIEADDTIGYIVTEYYKNVDNNITIVSTDRDFLQLVTDKIKVYSPVKKKLYDDKLLREEFNIHPNNYLLYRLFSGDSSDNIPGVKGIGLKSMIKRFPKIVEEEVKYTELIEKSKQRLEEGRKLKFYERISNAKDILELNYKLMQLQSANISGQASIHITDKMDEDIRKLNKFEFKKMFLEDGLYNSIKNVDKWLMNTYNRLNVYAR